jgi:hypothetical protein
MWPQYKDPPVRMRSPYSVKECERRLAEAADRLRRSMFSPSGFKGFSPYLLASGNGRYQLRKRIRFRSTFLPWLELTLSDEGRHTAVEVWLRQSAWCAFGAWCAILFGVPVGALIAITALARAHNQLWLALIPFSLAFVGGWLIPKFESLRFRAHGPELIALVRRELAARADLD